MATNLSGSILIIGNGFDLAHGLPTRYTDFLEFAGRVMHIYTYADKPDVEFEYNNTWIVPWSEEKPDDEARKFLAQKLKALFQSRKARYIQSVKDSACQTLVINVNDRLDLFNGYLKDNIWFHYITNLYNHRKTCGENWIDFEKEISLIVATFDNAHESLSQFLYDLDKKHLDAADLLPAVSEKISVFRKACAIGFNDSIYNVFSKFTVRDLRSKLYEDLENLILAFEIYLTDFVEEMHVTKTLTAIERIEPRYVMSFNYTKTYEKRYKRAGDSVQVCYVHGTCDKTRDPGNNNMVLGVDEYLPGDLQSEHTDFCIFKKFVQRIRKQNDVAYASWAAQFENDEPVIHESDYYKELIKRILNNTVTDVFICGHSLDVTDKDILRRFLISPSTWIHIFARDKVSEGELIANLIRITDEETVIKKSTINPPMIEFLKLE